MIILYVYYLYAVVLLLLLNALWSYATAHASLRIYIYYDNIIFFDSENSTTVQHRLPPTPAHPASLHRLPPHPEYYRRRRRRRRM